MRKDIVICEKDKESLKFLKEFFKEHRQYSAEFVSTLKNLEKRLKENPPDALIVGSPSCLGKINHIEARCPVIAMVSSIPEGLNRVIRHDIEYYMLSPYYSNDLAYKLDVVLNRRGCIETLYQEKKDLEAIVELTYLVSSTLDPQKVLYLAVKKLSEMMCVTRCSMLSVGAGRHANVVSTFENPLLKHLKLDLRKYPEIEKALKTKQTVIVKDAMKDPLMKPVRDIIAPLGIKSIVVVPVVFRDEIIGTLFLRTSRKRHTFTDREIKLCQGVASICANALNNALLFEKIKSEKAQLEKLAITDFLTGVYNIRYLYHRLENEFSRAQRYKTPLSCIMFDIDYFKRINDTYGHRTGDMVLREFAQLVKGYTRKSDIFARYGGEEFIMIMPHTPLKGAKAEAERLRNEIKKHRFKGLKPKTRITASIGIATFPHKTIKTQDDLISRADDALLQAKESGRNKIVLYK
jgi:two-component system cell cycle response regulator